METTGHNPAGDTAVVLAGPYRDDANLEPAPAGVAELARTAAWVIAADSGLDEADRLGITPNLVVGDLDSASNEALQRAEGAGVAVERHPVDKDATDLELALDAAVARGCLRVVVIGGVGGRLSHLLGNATVLTSPRYQFVEIEWLAGSARAYVVDTRRPCTIDGQPGDLVSLVPFGLVEGVESSGLRFGLEDDTLALGTTRGISNVLVETRATVEVASGVLLVIVESETT
ncbi:MAG: thiamine diphosphokinase [Acidimicrobiia bacterium]